MSDSENELGVRTWRDTLATEVPVGARIKIWDKLDAKEVTVQRIEIYSNEVRIHHDGDSAPMHTSRLRRIPVWRLLTYEELEAARSGDRKRQIRIAITALENWLWALEKVHGMPVEEIEKFRDEAERRMDPLLSDSPYIEYGTQWEIPAARTYPERDRAAALATIVEDRIASKSPENRGVIVYRRAPGAWKKDPNQHG